MDFDRSRHLKKLYLDEKNIGSGSVLPEDSSERSAISIKCCPLLNIVKEKNISKIDFLKIGIGGAEDRVLVPFFKRGPEQLFPGNIVIKNSQQKWSVDLFKVLNSYGYSIVFQTKMNTVFELK